MGNAVGRNNMRSVGREPKVELRLTFSKRKAKLAFPVSITGLALSTIANDAFSSSNCLK